MKLFLLFTLLTFAACLSNAKKQCNNVDQLIEDSNNYCLTDCAEFDTELCQKALSALTQYSRECTCYEDCQFVLVSAHDRFELCQNNKDLEEDDEDEDDEELDELDDNWSKFNYGKLKKGQQNKAITGKKSGTKQKSSGKSSQMASASMKTSQMKHSNSKSSQMASSMSKSSNMKSSMMKSSNMKSSMMKSSNMASPMSKSSNMAPPMSKSSNMAPPPKSKKNTNSGHHMSPPGNTSPNNPTKKNPTSIQPFTSYSNRMGGLASNPGAGSVLCNLLAVVASLVVTLKFVLF